MDFCKILWMGMVLLIGSSCSEKPHPEKVQISFNSNPSLGSENAEVEIIIFTDYECTYCKQLIGYLDGIKESHIEAGIVQVQIWDFPLEMHEQAFASAICAYCADQQGAFWEMHQLLYDVQEELDDELFITFANQLNLNMIEFVSCFASKAAVEKVESDIRTGEELGITGTPAFIINGNLFFGMPPEKVFQSLIEDELKK